MRKRLGRLFPALLLTGLTFYYLFRGAGDHASLLDGISPSAEWVSFHDQPGGRYDEILGLPWVEDLLRIFDEEVDDGTRFWIRELFPREVLLAREGGMGMGHSPGWVLISRISGRQARQRILLDLMGLDGYERVGKHNGNVIWAQFEAGRDPMAITLANGKLIFVVHEDPQAIRDVLDRLEGRRHRFSAFRTLPEALLPEASAPDRGFWLGNPLYPEPVGVVGDFSDPHGPGLRATGPGVKAFLVQESDETHAFAARLGGPSTMAMVRLPGLSGHGSRERTRPAHLLILGGDFRSPVAIVNAPTLVLIQEADSEVEARQKADRWMQKLNRLTGLQWAPVQTRRGQIYLSEDRMLRRFLGTENTPIARWEGGRLLLGSSGATLERLEERLKQPASEFELRDVPWRGEDTLLWISGERIPTDLRGILSLLGMLKIESLNRERLTTVMSVLPNFAMQADRFQGDAGDEVHLRLQYFSQK